MDIRIGVITVSDRASAGVYSDESGPAIEAWLNQALVSEWECKYRLIPDERDAIEDAIKELCDREGCCLVLTTGGTGPALRDITPEATTAVCSKMLPGFGEQMRSVSLKYVPTAILSRQTAGIRGSTLVINLPGRPKSIAECLEAVFPAVPYCIDLIEGPFLEVNSTFVSAFRPKGSVQ
jgi:molybdopterin adenylyltransferase